MIGPDEAARGDFTEDQKIRRSEGEKKTDLLIF
jgi:hypothetical protein